MFDGYKENEPQIIRPKRNDNKEELDSLENAMHEIVDDFSNNRSITNNLSSILKIIEQLQIGEIKTIIDDGVPRFFIDNMQNLTNEDDLHLFFCILNIFVKNQSSKFVKELIDEEFCSLLLSLIESRPSNHILNDAIRLLTIISIDIYKLESDLPFRLNPELFPDISELDISTAREIMNSCLIHLTLIELNEENIGLFNYAVFLWKPEFDPRYFLYFFTKCSKIIPNIFPHVNAENVFLEKFTPYLSLSFGDESYTIKEKRTKVIIDMFNEILLGSSSDQSIVDTIFNNTAVDDVIKTMKESFNPDLIKSTMSFLTEMMKYRDYVLTSILDNNIQFKKILLFSNINLKISSVDFMESILSALVERPEPQIKDVEQFLDADILNSIIDLIDEDQEDQTCTALNFLETAARAAASVHCFEDGFSVLNDEDLDLKLETLRDTELDLIAAKVQYAIGDARAAFDAYEARRRSLLE